MWIYFDHVLASNRGVAYRFYYFLEKKYWMSLIPDRFIKKVEDEKAGKKKRPYTDQDLGELQDTSETMNSVKKEKNKVIENHENNVFADGIRIMNIQKTYKKLPFGMTSAKDVHAVRGIFLEI